MALYRRPSNIVHPSPYNHPIQPQNPQNGLGVGPPALARDFSTLSKEWNVCMLESTSTDMADTSPFPEHASRTDCSVEQMKNLMDSRNTEGVTVLQKDYRGPNGLCRQLRTSPTHGFTATPATLHGRGAQFGTNVYHTRALKSYPRLVIEYLIGDIPLLIILVTALIALGLAFYHDPNGHHAPATSSSGGGGASAHSLIINSAAATLSDGGASAHSLVQPLADPSPSASGDHGTDAGSGAAEPNSEWVEGAFKIVMCTLVVLIATLNDWFQDRHFRTIQNRIKAQSKQSFPVIRNGQQTKIPVREIVVGDICVLQNGSIIPADGVLVSEGILRVDEKLLTDDENDAKKDLHTDPFLLTGSKVTGGNGQMVVTAVGDNTQSGIILKLIGARTAYDSRQYCCWCCKKSSHGGHGHGPDDIYDYSYKAIVDHPVEHLAIQIMICGVLLGLLTSVIWWIRLTVDIYVVKGEKDTSKYLWNYVHYLVKGIQVVLVAVPEGLPIVAAVAMAYQAWRARRDRIKIRYLKSGESVGHTTHLCADMTGVITSGRFAVVHGFICDNYYREMAPLKKLPSGTLDMLSMAIAVNTRYSSNIVVSKEGTVTDVTNTKQVGDRTECALLRFLSDIGRSHDSFRAHYPKDGFLKVYSYNAARRARSTVVRMPGGASMVFSMGPANTLLKRCSYIIDQSGRPTLFSPSYQNAVCTQTLNLMRSYDLRPLCVAYKEYPPGVNPNWDNESDVLRDLVCVAVLGIEDPVQAEMPETLRSCRKAGIDVVMLTGADPGHARSVAYRSGLLEPAQKPLSLAGDEFNRSISDKPGEPANQKSLDRIWPSLKVLASSTPLDKAALVRGIRNSSLSHDHAVVSCTGRAIDDGLALKKADIGHALGLSGTPVAKKLSDIVIRDDRLKTILRSIHWGRNMYDSIAKFVQFQLVIIIVGVVSLIGSAIGYMKRDPLTEIQLVWLCLVVVVLGAIGMATEEPNDDQMKRKPVPRHQHLVSHTMLKNVIFHSCYQIFVVFLLWGVGYQIMNIEDGRINPSVHSQHLTTIFHSFVLMSLCNLICSRMLHNELNMFRGLHRNIILIIILVLLFVVQIIIIQFGSYPFSTKPLTITQWLWCLFFAFFEFVLAMLIAFIPLEKVTSKCCPPLVGCCKKAFTPCWKMCCLCSCCHGDKITNDKHDSHHDSSHDSHDDPHKTRQKQNIPVEAWGEPHNGGPMEPYYPNGYQPYHPGVPQPSYQPAVHPR